jgi:hypothetical protein
MRIKQLASKKQTAKKVHPSTAFTVTAVRTKNSISILLFLLFITESSLLNKLTFGLDEVKEFFQFT